ncbi:MAG: PIG-L family deacetylase [Thermoanaerobaculia bacterium]
MALTAAAPAPSPPPDGGPARTAGALRRLARRVAPGLRALVVTAHPDDETLGATTLFSRAREVHLLCLTDGAPRAERFRPAGAPRRREDYARLRRRELEAALAEAGVAPERLEQLDVPDQEALWNLPRLVGAVAGAVGRLAPDLVVTHPYEGGHPDHDAAALAVSRGAAGWPVAEMTSYHRVPGGHSVQDFLPAETDRWAVAIPLDDAECALRRRMLDRHSSQAEVLRGFPEPSAEGFRPAPRYDFAAPPHPGPLFYELLGMPPGAAAWRAAAAGAVPEVPP